MERNRFTPYETLCLNVLYFIDAETGELIKPIRFGLPKGNLNRTESNRGCTKTLFDLAGYNIKGYEPGKEEDMPRVKELEGLIEFYCMKPRQLPALLDEHLIDIAIIGRDTIEEYLANLWKDIGWAEKPKQNFLSKIFMLKKIKEKQGTINFALKKLKYLFEEDYNPLESVSEEDYNSLKQRRILEDKFKMNLGESAHKHYEFFIKSIFDLGYGRVDVVLAAEESFLRGLSLEQPETSRSIISAYPNLTYKFLSRFIPRDYLSVESPSKEKNKDLYEFIGFNRFRENYAGPKINIVPFSSSTELMIKIGSGSFIVDCISSGKSLARNKLIAAACPLLKNSTTRLCLSPFFNKHFYESQEFGLNPHIVKFNEFISRLKSASLEYGKTRRDSIYYGGGKIK